MMRTNQVDIEYPVTAPLSDREKRDLEIVRSVARKIIQSIPTEQKEQALRAAWGEMLLEGKSRVIQPNSRK